MNEHSAMTDLLPLYVSGALPAAERQAVELHLAGCSDCRTDLELWKAVAGEIVSANRRLVAPTAPAERTLRRVRRRPLFDALQHAALLLRAELPLVRREIWPASLAVMALGCAVAFLSGHAEVVRVMSPRQILLARLTLVYGYNLLLALTASLGLFALVPVGTLAQLILGWLGPMTFLSALALVLSLWMGTAHAVAIAYSVWLVHLMASGGLIDASFLVPAPVAPWLAAYQQFWTSPVLLLGLAAALAAATVWRAGWRADASLRWSQGR